MKCADGVMAFAEDALIGSGAAALCFQGQQYVSPDHIPYRRLGCLAAPRSQRVSMNNRSVYIEHNIRLGASTNGP